MTATRTQKDLVILVADKHAEFTIKGILSRCKSLGIRQPDSDLFVHPHKDSGCLRDGPDFLRSFSRSHDYALLFMDREGCGNEGLMREELEQQLEHKLSLSGWKERAAAVVLDPELEIWVWSDSPHVAEVLGWTDSDLSLHDWLIQKGFLQPGRFKPERPKEAMESALKQAKKQHSSVLFHRLAQRVSMDRCADPAFLKLKEKLREWFS